jgi:hypothetical protein
MGTQSCAGLDLEGEPTLVDADEAERLNAWQRAHHVLSRLARRRATLDAEEGRWLLAALRATAHVHLGFGSFGEYVERLFGYSPRSTHEKLRVAEALEQLPILLHALEDGALSWSAVRELTRVACPETEAEWLGFALDKSVRQLEQVVAGARPGDTPASVQQPGRRHVLRFDVAPETLALFREASSRLRREAGASFDDDALLLAMARGVLGGPTDPGRASYQVSLSVCPDCGRAAQHANGELVLVGAEVLAMASCDAQNLGTVSAPANDLSVGCAESRSNAHVGRDSDAHVGCDSDAHVGADPNPLRDVSHHTHVDVDAGYDTPAGSLPRAKQTIPPKLRRSILLRDERCCRVPGCRNALYLDVHHILPRSSGGQNETQNLITLCGAHHRAVHRGDLVVEHTDLGVRFRHADGRKYGDAARPPQPTLSNAATWRARPVELHAKVRSALRHLGFRDTDVRGVLDELQEKQKQQAPDLPPLDTAEQLLRAALVRLGPGRRRSS